MTAAGRITAGSAAAARQQQAAARQRRASAREKAGSGERAPCEGKESRSRGGWMALVYEIHGDDARLPSAVSRGFFSLDALVDVVSNLGPVREVNKPTDCERIA
ncbi:unnamed protein product [Miscanthus lutarioriparius]|uniref:Uncharacterized protein n=1 Tax=Miscanthus lutarioriparius TaxID=422564 RepID=A0A811PW65_9POAL|nr:unnamed protein product [Miscanthus lutarioriparius]